MDRTSSHATQLTVAIVGTATMRSEDGGCVAELATGTFGQRGAGKSFQQLLLFPAATQRGSRKADWPKASLAGPCLSMHDKAQDFSCEISVLISISERLLTPRQT